METLSNHILLDNMPGAIGIKDRNSVYIAGNDLLASYMGYKKGYEIEGLTDMDVRSEMAELAPVFVEQDLEVLERGESQHLDIGRYPDGSLQVHFSVKKPFVIDGVIKGTVYTCLEMQSKLFARLYKDYLSLDGPGFFAIGGQYDDYQLTRRQSETLFFLIRGYTVKQIAKRLHLSPKTVEHYIAQVRCLLDCASRSELIEKAIHLGFIFNIPMSMIE